MPLRPSVEVALKHKAKPPRATIADAFELTLAHTTLAHTTLAHTTLAHTTLAIS